jgi:hypothetical protein
LQRKNEILTTVGLLLRYIAGIGSAPRYTVIQEMVASLSPYITAHVNRFGDYRMDFDDYVPKPAQKMDLPVFFN